MKKVIFERAETCKLVKERTVENGHDCWGNTDWYTEHYVYIKEGDKLKERRVSLNNGYIIVHDDKEVISVELIKYLPKEVRILMETDSEKRDRIIENIVEK